MSRIKALYHSIKRICDNRDENKKNPNIKLYPTHSPKTKHPNYENGIYPKNRALLISLKRGSHTFYSLQALNLLNIGHQQLSHSLSNEKILFFEINFPLSNFVRLSYFLPKQESL